MAKRFICLLMATSAIGMVPLFAQKEAPAAVGTLILNKKTYTLKHALAYETTIDDEQAIAVVLSGQAVSSEKLRKREKQKRTAATAISIGHS
jgi:hypothetical protein